MNTDGFIWTFKLTVGHSEVKLATKSSEVQQYRIATVKEGLKLFRTTSQLFKVRLISISAKQETTDHMRTTLILATQTPCAAL